ncbi:hypothetical protein AVEN_154094-1 [Araneus ventricosus]|uniref:Uncharacterized protein n=1 Tax=Araneus ventricosus TaxID=182803 RepID=A0A4Y2TNB0_ARAVE|nr:hypothetical protein AVEN_36711-1 [Araneus ventricosus]GBO02135.1 hypothetical protein AVEN_154094-1 [Araneus ventricosus]
MDIFYTNWSNSLMFSLVILRSRFEQHEGYFGTNLVILNLGQMTRTTPELAPPSPNFHATPTGGRLTTTYDLTCNRPHTRRIFSGIGFRTWNPPPPKPRPYH